MVDEKVVKWLGKDNEIGIDIWEKKYRHNNESFDEWLDRVSGGDESVRSEIEAKRFIFGGRILANRGLYKEGIKVTYSNCYVLPPPQDSIESIYDTASKLARTFSYGGGVGIDISNLAPKGARVNNTAKETSGAVSFMDLYGMTTSLIGQNGRRGALMISIACDHPDIEEFIDIKSDLDKVTTANISVRVTNAFMEAVERNEDITLSYERPEVNQTITKTVNARRLFKKLAYNNWDMGEPGVLFWDRINTWNLLSEDDEFKYAGTNPCLSGNTLIQTTDGNIPIKDLVGLQPDVYCMNSDGELTIGRAKKIWCTRKDAQTITVITGKGNITCTPDHLIFTTNRGWVEAKLLKKGDKIKGLNRQMKGESHVSVGLSGTKYVPEHRFVLGYYEDITGLDVHHVDGDTFNNRVGNLKALGHSEHSKITNTGRTIEYNRDSRNGRFLPKKNKAKRSNKNQGKQVGNNWYVKEVRWNSETEDVYDIAVEKYHNFVANDMIVHNCAEEPLPAGGSCLLGSINLSEFVVNPYNPFSESHIDFEKLGHTVAVAVKALNDVLDEGLPLHPLQIQRDTVRDWRQIGLGVFGIADMLIKMGVEYGSEDAEILCGRIAETIAKESIFTSSELARVYGKYPAWDDNVLESKYLKNILEYDDTLDAVVYHQGLRNSQLLTIAPTGTLSTMLQVSGGIEPYYATSWQRTTKSLHGEDVVYTERPKAIKELMEVMGISDDRALPKYVVTSSTINPMNRINMQSIWQRYVDASISSTINLPNDTTPEEVEKIYMEAWKAGLKGITVFRDGCRRVGILSTDNNKEDDDTPIDIPRGIILDVSDDLISAKRTIRTGCGKLYMHLDFDEVTGEPMETFVECGSGGGCERNLTFISRLMSLALRGGIPIESIIDQAMSIKPCKAYCDRTKLVHDTSKGTSCPSALGNAMLDLYDKIQNRVFDDSDSVETDYPHESLPYEETPDMLVDCCENREVCPECGAKIVYEGGCNICKSCGWSRCG